MRSTNVGSPLVAWFHGDVDGGGVLVAHETCPTQLDTSGVINDEPAYCEYCKKELLYGSWCSW